LNKLRLACASAKWHPVWVRITLICGALLLSSAVLPAEDIKPFDVKLGLWETTSTTEMSGMAMPAMPQIPPDALSRMPPEQRARIEAMMKGRGGSPNSMTVKSCITKDTLARAGAFGQSDKSCTMKLVSSTPAKQVIHMECTRDTNHMTGDMTIERVDAEHVKGSSIIKAEGEHAVTVKSTFETKYLSSDCGDVKPVLPK
jgi:hypothetical protein